MDAFVPLTTNGGRGNDGAGAKPSGRADRPSRSALRAVVRVAAEVAAQPVRWLWKDQWALGKISVVAGAANVGKSLVTGDFAARVSVRAAWPDGSPCPVGDVPGMTERRIPSCRNFSSTGPTCGGFIFWRDLPVPTPMTKR
jgi:hypothetical protein